MASAITAPPRAAVATDEPDVVGCDGSEMVVGAARRRVAVLSTWHPMPPDNGRKQRTLAMIAALARDYDIVLVSLTPPDEIGQIAARTVPGVWRQHVAALPVFRPRSPSALLAGIGACPRALRAVWNQRVADVIADAVGCSGAEAVIGTDLRTLPYLQSLVGCVATILDEPDVSPFLYDARTVKRRRDRLRARAREWKYRRLLRIASSRLDAVIVASAQEAYAYRELSGSSAVTLVENGVPELPAGRWSMVAGEQLLYCGSLTYAPNAEAVTWFVRHVLPHIEPEAPTVRLVVTGALPTARVPAAEHPNVRLTGRLAATDEAMRESRVCVVPLWSGTGTRIKILEALAYGMPVVTTSKGAEGLAVMHGQHVLVADTPQAFASAVLQLLRDPELSLQLGERGRELVRRRYTWDVHGEQLRGLVRRVLPDDAPCDGHRW